MKNKIKKVYGEIAIKETGCCSSCSCSPENFAKSIGYSEKELNKIPKGSNLALSCGNPTALAGLKKGETVLDLGSGAGFDCFLAASKVGPTGKVIGIDMTKEMVKKAKNITKRIGSKNIDFRLGDIEKLPVKDNSVDVIISNCVINLSTNKFKALKEAYRVLKPGGRIAISDIALLKKLPPEIKKSDAAYTGCIAGAILVSEYERLVKSAGFKKFKITRKYSIKPYAVSIYIEGYK